MPPKACIFDAYGTLFDLRFPLDKYKDILRGKETELMNLWREKQLSYTWLRGLMGSYLPFWEVTQDALRYSFEALDIEDEIAFKGIVNNYLKPDVYLEVPEVLGSLKDRGIKTAILSNGSPEMLESGIKYAGISDLLDEVFSVDSLKTFKPDPRVYQLPLDHWGLNNREVIFFSSNSWDIAGATNFGLFTCWINRFDATWEHLGVVPDADFYNLKESLSLFL